MIDITHDPDTDRPYECFECGSIVTAADNPKRCPDCGGELRNRQMPIE